MKIRLAAACTALLVLSACGNSTDASPSASTSTSVSTSVSPSPSVSESASPSPSESSSGPAVAADAASIKAQLTTQILKSPTALSSDPITKKQAGCVATKVVDGLGVETMQGYGMIGADGKLAQNIDSLKLEKPDATTLANSFIGCVDFEKIIEASIMTSAGDSLTTKQKACFRRVIDTNLVRAALVSAFTGGDSAALQTKMQTKLSGCA